MSYQRKIAIVGGGPGGLLCARILQRSGVTVSVFDADTALDSRDTGGTLDLHADSGQIAMQDAGLFDEFKAVARQEGQAKKRLDCAGNLMGSYLPPEDEYAAPEIDRGQLRNLLANSLKADTVHWGHKLVNIACIGQAGHRLEFANGRVFDADVVIGADGAWSAVRRALSPAQPTYSGFSYLDVAFDNVDARHKDMAALVGQGHVFISDGAGHGIIGQRNSSGRIRGYIALKIEADWHLSRQIDLDDGAAVREFLLNQFGHWAPHLLTFITDTDHPYINRPIYSLPAPFVWEHKRGITLIGDAAHLMAPFGGFGVNLALLDGAELAQALIENENTDQALCNYETGMFRRSGELAKGANAALAHFFSEEALNPANLRDHEQEHAQYKAAAEAYRQNRSV